MGLVDVEELCHHLITDSGRKVLAFAPLGLCFHVQTRSGVHDAVSDGIHTQSAYAAGKSRAKNDKLFVKNASMILCRFFEQCR
jgi:hypothetical protein